MVGLFGTCGKSTWRNKFMEAFDQAGIKYFNPQVDNWTPELAIEEAKHLAHDEIILFPVTDETYATGSLAETGFSILQALKTPNRHVFIFIDDKLAPNLIEENPLCAKESIRARKLVIAHLANLNLPTVHQCASLDDMLAQTLNLHSEQEIETTEL